MEPHASYLTLAYLLADVRAYVTATPGVKRIALGGDVENIEEELKALSLLPLTEEALAELRQLIEFIREASIAVQDLATVPPSTDSNESMNVGRWTPNGAWQQDVARRLDGVAMEVARRLEGVATEVPRACRRR